MGLFDSIRRVVGGGESATDDGDGDGDLSGLVDTSTLDEAALRRHAEDVAGEVEQLDFSLDSLEQFDSAIDAGYDEELEVSDDPATYATDVVRFGCYLGEVLVRRYDGEWTNDPQWGVTITGPDDSATVSVFEVAQRSIETKAVFAAVTERAAEEVGLEPDDAEAMPDQDETAASGTETEAAEEPTGDDTAGDADTGTAAESTDSSPTIDPDDWDESETASQTPVPDDESEPADSDDSTPLESEASAETETAESESPLEEDSESDAVVEGPVSGPDEATDAETTVDDSASPPGDELDEDESAPSPDVVADTDDAEPSTDDEQSTDDDQQTDDEPPISEVAESEYGFEFESAADRETEPDEPATEPLSGDSEPSEPSEPDESVADTTTDPETEAPLSGSDSSGDSTTDEDPSDDGIAMPAVEDTSTDAEAEEPAVDVDAESTAGDAEAEDTSADVETAEPSADAELGDTAADAETEDTSADADDVAGLVEEAEPDTARNTPESESLFEEAESPTTAESSGPAAQESTAAQPEADDPTQGDGMRAEYASEAEAFVSFWNEHDLDYTPESLERLDDLVAAEWDDDRFDDAEFGSEETFDDRAFTSVSRELGSYFGEVLVRELDGEWTDETTNDSVVVTGPDGPLAIPVFRVAGTSLKERPVFARSYDSLLSDIDS